MGIGAITFTMEALVKTQIVNEVKQDEVKEGEKKKEEKKKNILVLKPLYH